MNCMADSRENYWWNLGSWRVKHLPFLVQVVDNNLAIVSIALNHLMQLKFFLYICVIIWENRFKPLPMIFQISTKVCHRTVQFVQNIDNHWMANCRDQVTIVLVISCKNVALIMIIIIIKKKSLNDQQQ